MKNALKLLLAHALVAAPLVAAVAPSIARATEAPAKTGPLGDLSEYLVIAKDTQKIAKEGDMPKARTRIKELEKAWDAGEDKRRPMNADAWIETDTLMDK